MEKTHWKKNNDSRYITGEDVKHGATIGKGITDGMVVSLVDFGDMETFDQSTQSEVIKTGLRLQDENGNLIYKPLIMNNSNAQFCIKEFKSEFVNEWVGKKMILYAKPDKRHGYVARLKKYVPKQEIDFTPIVKNITNAKSLDDLKLVWESLSVSEKNIPQVIAEKERVKNLLSSPV